MRCKLERHAMPSSVGTSLAYQPDLENVVVCMGSMFAVGGGGMVEKKGILDPRIQTFSRSDINITVCIILYIYSSRA